MSQLKTLKIRMRCFLMDEIFLWFIPEEANILCKYNMKSDLIEVMHGLPCQGSYNMIIKCETQMVFVPYSAEKILIFNMDTEMFIQIGLPETKETYRDTVKFFSGLKKGKNIYLIPGNYPYFLKVDLEHLEVEKSANVFQMCALIYNGFADKWTITASAWDGDNTVYFGSGNDKENICLGKLQLDTMQFDIRKSEYAESWVKGMIWYEGYVFLYSGDGKIVKLNQNLDSIKVIADKTLYDYRFPYSMNILSVFAYDEKIFFVRSYELDTVILNLRDGHTVSKIKLTKETILYAGITHAGLLLETNKVGCFYLIEKEKCTEKAFRVEAKVMQDCFFRMMTSGERDIFQENVIMQLSEWILSVPDKSICEVSEQKCGETIFKYINHFK